MGARDRAYRADRVRRLAQMVLDDEDRAGDRELPPEELREIAAQLAEDALAIVGRKDAEG